MIFIIGNLSDYYGEKYNVLSHHDVITKQMILSYKDGSIPDVASIYNNKITQMQLWMGGINIDNVRYDYIIFYNDKIQAKCNENLEREVCIYKSAFRNEKINSLLS